MYRDRIKINHSLNIINKDLFDKHPYDYSIKYKCVICENEMTLHRMMSKLGERAICMTCVLKHFSSRDVARKWIDDVGRDNESAKGRYK